ncbi:MAG: nucleotide exchange factor GrpE [Pseudomonadota bacterium]
MNGAEKRPEEMTPEELAAADAAADIDSDLDEADADEAEESGWETPPEDASPDYEAVIGALQDELQEARDQRMRTAAEMENLRRRTAREVADAKKFAVSSFARDLLSVSDNLTRALTVVSDEEKGGAGEVWKNLLEGVQMTERELLTVLDKNGVTKIDPQGEKFDPNKHQAMFDVPDPSQPNGTVVQVVAPGFVIGERVLRPAMVGVSKGGPKEAPKPAAGTAAAGETIDKSA